MTPRDICQLALKLCGAIGVGQTPLAEDTNDAFTMLNMMLGQWSQKRWLVYHLVDVSFVATGAAGYTIGVGGSINTARPDRIASAFARFRASAYPIDYPLEVIEARETWNALSSKTMPGMPSRVFYDSGFPLGTVYLTPVPSSQYEIHLSLKQPLPSFANLSDQVVLPDEYQEALLYNLAARLFAPYGLAVRPDIVALAKSALNTVRASNTQIPTLRMPVGMPGVGWGGGYSPYGGFAMGGPTLPPTPAPIRFTLDVSALDSGAVLDGYSDLAAPLDAFVLNQNTLS